MKAGGAVPAFAAVTDDQPSDRPAVLVAARYQRGLTIAIIVILWAWHLVADAPAVLGSWRAYRPPVTSPAAWVAFTVVGLVATWWLRTPNGPGSRAAWAWALAGILLVFETACYVAGPPDGRFRASNWVFGAVGWFAIVVFWHRRGLTDLLVFLGLHTVLSSVLLVVALPVARAGVAQYIMIHYGTCALQLAFAAGYRATGQAAKWAARASAATAQLTTARITALAVHQTRQERYQSIRDSAAQLLAGLAGGSLDPADPVTRQRCAMEAARLRRLLAETDDVPEPLLHELRACADIVERRGVEVELVAVGQLPKLSAATRRQLAEPPIAVLVATRTRARITVAALADDVAVSILADSDLAWLAGVSTDQVTVTYHREGPLLWTETRWRDRSALASSTTTRS